MNGNERKMNGNERKMNGNERKWKQWATLRYINTKQGPTDLVLVDLVDLVGGGINPLLALYENTSNKTTTAGQVDSGGPDHYEDPACFSEPRQARVKYNLET